MVDQTGIEPVTS